MATPSISSNTTVSLTCKDQETLNEILQSLQFQEFNPKSQMQYCVQTDSDKGILQGTLHNITYEMPKMLMTPPPAPTPKKDIKASATYISPPPFLPSGPSNYVGGSQSSSSAPLPLAPASISKKSLFHKKPQSPLPSALGPIRRKVGEIFKAFQTPSDVQPGVLAMIRSGYRLVSLNHNTLEAHFTRVTPNNNTKPY